MWYVMHPNLRARALLSAEATCTLPRAGLMARLLDIMSGRTQLRNSLSISPRLLSVCTCNVQERLAVVLELRLAVCAA